MPSCLIVASHFPPFQSAGVFRTVRIAKYLPDLGWEIQVLTLKPSAYLADSSTSSELLDQIPSEVQIHRTTAKHPHQWISAAKHLLKQGKTTSPPKANSVSSAPSATSPSASPAGTTQRIKDAVTLPWMTPDRWVGWLPFATGKGKRMLKNNPVDVLYSSGPPWTNHLVAHRLHRYSGTPWVADFRDPWLGNNFRPQREGETWVGRRHQSLERQVIETAEVVIVNTPRALDVVRDRYPELPEEKFQVIPNGFDPSDFATDSHDQSSLPESDPQSPLKIVHTGAFYGKRNVDALLHAIGDAFQQGRLNRNDLQVELVGAARPNRTREADIAAERGIADIVRVTPRMPHHECLQEMRQADVLLLVQTEAPLCVPGKLYEYIAIGRPILTLSAAGATADIVSQEQLGPCVDPDDPEALQSCLCQLVSQHRNRALPRPSGSAVDRYDGRGLMKRFDAALQAAISAHPPSNTHRS